ncbi:FCD domain-containing protein [Mycobacterium sp. 1245805.9]|uniref:FCD domain-containing protein n=1 Tax=Mycobacterium sp. 1245805.9 TaxID=1856862 RepID=UPI00080240E4|nr:FCD domain-containing protein [Mycobacterium sp. 1245805.9]OBI82301.1 hypothetical protein A9X00_07965 [Mycobacterium sp. 1245805.9]
MTHSGSGKIRQAGSDGLRDQLRNMILSAEIVWDTRDALPGTTRRTGSNVISTLEGLRDSAATGLLNTDASELREVYTLRSMLEPRAMAELAALPEADRSVACTRAAELLDQMDTEADVATWAGLNRDFYRRLTHPLRTSRPLLCDLVRSLRERSTPPTVTVLHAQPALTAQARRDYRILVSVIREGDSSLAARITVGHLNRSMKYALQSPCEMN